MPYKHRTNRRPGASVPAGGPVRRTIAFFVVVLCAAAQQDAKVTFLATQASVQDAARTIAAQAGFSYNWQKSFDQTDPMCRRWLRDLRLESVPFATAMHQILDPIGLRYAVEDGAVVLYPATDARQPGGVLARTVNYFSAQKSVQYIVIELANLVGLGYNWEKSFAQTDPECRRFVNDVAIKNQPFDKAMAAILNPVGLRYLIEDNRVVLYPR